MILIQTDGSAESSSRIGGWAYEIYRNNNVIDRTSGCNDDATNNKMELTAIRYALRMSLMLAKHNECILLQTDSNWAFDCIYEHSNCILNLDLLNSIKKLIKNLNVTIVRVDRKKLKHIDKLAKQAMKIGKEKYAR
jgi:ribonuclease HI